MAAVGTPFGRVGELAGRGRARRALGVLGAAAFVLTACGQASDSVTSADRVSTVTKSPAVSAGPRQTTAPPTTAAGTTTSPTVPATVAAPPTSRAPGDGAVSTVAPPVQSGETLPTVVPTSAPDISTTAPTEPTTTTTTVPTPSTAPPAAGSVNITSVTCGNHAEGDWVVFYATGQPGAVKVISIFTLRSSSMSTV